jgi:hypothetical protein
LISATVSVPFEREVMGERIRDKIEASKKEGMWMGAAAPPGYAARGGTDGFIVCPD